MNLVLIALLTLIVCGLIIASGAHHRASLGALSLGLAIIATITITIIITATDRISATQVLTHDNTPVGYSDHCPFLEETFGRTRAITGCLLYENGAPRTSIVVEELSPITARRSESVFFDPVAQIDSDGAVRIGLTPDGRVRGAATHPYGRIFVEDRGGDHDRVRDYLHRTSLYLTAHCNLYNTDECTR